MAVSSAQNPLGGCIHIQGVAHTMKHSQEERGLLSSMPGHTLAHQHKEAEQSSPALYMSLVTVSSYCTEGIYAGYGRCNSHEVTFPFKIPAESDAIQQ